MIHVTGRFILPRSMPMPNVLIAEDEARIAAFIAKGLQKHGFHPLIAANGIEAIQIAAEQAIDVLLLDLGLPGHDGWQVLESLQRLGKRPPVVIVVTARDDISDRLKSQILGVTDYVLKPFQFSDLLARIRTQLKPL